MGKSLSGSGQIEERSQSGQREKAGLVVGPGFFREARGGTIERLPVFLRPAGRNARRREGALESVYRLKAALCKIVLLKLEKVH